MVRIDAPTMVTHDPRTSPHCSGATEAYEVWCVAEDEFAGFVATWDCVRWYATIGAPAGRWVGPFATDDDAARDLIGGG